MTAEEYWKQNVQHHDQKFYAAFCLLGAACSDYAVGIDLNNERKLTWAVTASYYALVHCGRLACFIALGDFPTSHLHLKQLFMEGQVAGRTWMGRFKGFLDADDQDIEPQRNFSRDDLVAHFPHAVGIQAQFEEWGQILSKAKDLRNDSNYEGLLIAHEYNHVKVTEALGNLVRVLRCACETVLPQAISLMKGFVASSERGQHWCAFLNWEAKREGLYYLVESLHSRVNNQEAYIKVAEFLSPLRQLSDQHLDLAIEVGKHVEIGAFGGKAALMDTFQNKIGELERHIMESNAL